MNMLSKAALSALSALAIVCPVRADEIASRVGPGSIEPLVQTGLLVSTESGWYQIDRKRLSEVLEAVNSRNVEAVELLQCLQQIMGNNARIESVEPFDIPLATQDRAQ